MIQRVWNKLKRTFFKPESKDNPVQDYAYRLVTYAQEGEDIVLSRFVGSKTDGFFIDVGAHHPFRFSNTYFFYLKGWRGINIDAMPGSMDLFKQVRPNDINIEVPVSAKPQELVYNIFNEPALNTFSAEEAAKKEKIPGYFLVEKKQVATRTLADLLDEYLPEGKVIDFLTIDVEGLDFEVLTSNNWEKYRPEFVLVEDLSRRSIDVIIEDSQVFKFMVSRDYAFVAKTMNTLFFRKGSL